MNCCHANCNQGRLCPIRQACELPADDIDPSKPNVLASALLYGGIPAVIVAVALAFYFR